MIDGCALPVIVSLEEVRDPIPMLEKGKIMLVTINGAHIATLACRSGPRVPPKDQARVILTPEPFDAFEMMQRRHKAFLERRSHAVAH